MQNYAETNEWFSWSIRARVSIRMLVEPQKLDKLFVSYCYVECWIIYWNNIYLSHYSHFTCWISQKTENYWMVTLKIHRNCPRKCFFFSQGFTKLFILEITSRTRGSTKALSVPSIGLTFDCFKWWPVKWSKELC